MYVGAGFFQYNMIFSEKTEKIIKTSSAPKYGIKFPYFTHLALFLKNSSSPHRTSHFL